MITARRSGERHHQWRGRRESWSTFAEATGGSVRPGFGALDRLDEAHMPPGGLVHHALPRDAEVIVYVREGAMSWKDSSGAAGVICAGEFQRSSASVTLHRDEQNASSTEWNVALEMSLQPPGGRLGPGQEQERFSSAERRDGLCLVASPDGRRGSLHLHQSCFVFSALVHTGQHLVHELGPERVAWLHVVQGEVELGGLILTSGDGAGITGERSVSFTAHEEAEVLLLDLEAV